MGQCQHRTTFTINFEELGSAMLHAAFQNHRTSGAEEEDHSKMWRAAWSCYLDFLYKLSFPLSMLALNMKLSFDWPITLGEKDI